MPARRTGSSFAVEVTEYSKTADNNGKVKDRNEDRCHGFPSVKDGLRELVVVGVDERDEDERNEVARISCLVNRSNSEVKRRENNLNCDTSASIIQLHDLNVRKADCQ